MPWHVEHGGGTCSASQWAVIKDSDGSTAGCHPTKEAAQRQVAALYANESNMTASPDLQQRRDLGIPNGIKREQPFASQFEVRMVDWQGEQRYRIHGVASSYEKPYEMFDNFGAYNEVVAHGAGAVSLASEPDVAFLVNHKGVTMARTTNGSLVLHEEDGLVYDAFVNPKRQDVRDLVTAIQDGHLDESSFAFMITDGVWSDDFTEYRINSYDINRGDVSAVNYGANPHTSVGARSREILADLELLPTGAARAALQRLQARTDIAPRIDVRPEPEWAVSLDLAQAQFEIENL